MSDRYYEGGGGRSRFQPEESFERRRPRSPSQGRRRTVTEVIERRGPEFIDEDRARRDVFEEDRMRRDRENDRVLVRRTDIEATRRRSPSPSPAPRGILRRARSVSPSRYERERDEIDRLHREETITTHQHQHQQREHQSTRSPRPRSPSPGLNTRLRSRFDDSRRDVEEHERIETRVIERERKIPAPPSPESSRSSSPEPAAPVIKGPTIEREVVTHYRDIDHGEFCLCHPLQRITKCDVVECQTKY